MEKTNKVIGMFGSDDGSDYIGVSVHSDYVVIHALERLVGGKNNSAFVFIDYPAVIALRDALNECINNKALS